MNDDEFKALEKSYKAEYNARVIAEFEENALVCALSLKQKVDDLILDLRNKEHWRRLPPKLDDIEGTLNGVRDHVYFVQRRTEADRPCVKL